LYYLEILNSITSDNLQGLGKENSPLSSAFGTSAAVYGQVGTYEEEQHVAFFCYVLTNVDMVPNRTIAAAHPITLLRLVTGRSSWKIVTKQNRCSEVVGKDAYRDPWAQSIITAELTVSVGSLSLGGLELHWHLLNVQGNPLSTKRKVHAVLCQSLRGLTHSRHDRTFSFALDHLRFRTYATVRRERPTLAYACAQLRT